MNTYYFENYKSLVPANVTELFDRDLVLSISDIKSVKPDHVRILSLWCEDSVSFTKLLNALNGKKGRFQSQFYVSGAETGWFIVDGKEVNIVVSEVKDTQSFREMYTEYMNRHGIGLSRYERLKKVFGNFFNALERVNLEEF